MLWVLICERGLDLVFVSRRQQEKGENWWAFRSFESWESKRLENVIERSEEYISLLLLLIGRLEWATVRGGIAEMRPLSASTQGWVPFESSPKGLIVVEWQTVGLVAGGWVGCAPACCCVMSARSICFCYCWSLYLLHCIIMLAISLIHFVGLAVKAMKAMKQSPIDWHWSHGSSRWRHKSNKNCTPQTYTVL